LSDLRPGDRVTVSPDYHWAKGATGVVATIPPEAAGPLGWTEDHRREVPTRRGVNVIHWVEFDEPQMDGDGDGPYHAAEIRADALARTEG
jgi:hypothetical protein